jgi:class 3 adenylate cyclase
MNLPKWGWITSKLLIFLLIPTFLYLWIGQILFTSHLKTVVTNDPDAGLTRSISALNLALDEEYQILLSQIKNTTDKDWILKNLANPQMTLAQYHQMGSDLSGYLQRPLFILAGKNGEILFDSIGLPKTETIPPSTPAAINSATTASLTPSYSPTPQTIPFSVKDWPGFAESFEKDTEMGLTTYGNQYYLSVCAPIISKKKVIGAIALGMKLDSDVMERIKSITQNDILFYTNGHIQISTFPNSLSSEVNKAAFSPRRSAIMINDQKFIWDDVPINDLDQTVTGHFFVFQPVRETITVDSSALKQMIQLAVIFVLVMLVLGIWYNLNLLSPLHQIIKQTNLIKKGKWNTLLPIKRPDDWGKLARSLHEMILNLKDKERITLILGKVVSPRTTQTILAENNYFALKGERRECTLLQVQIKGFDTLSQSAEPEVVVEVLNDYFSLINQIVFDHEGMVDKFIGDKVLAVWGAPLADNDKELKAVRATLEIQKAVQELNSARVHKGHIPFDLAIGIHTGWVICGNLGSDQYYDYSVIGEPLQIADKTCGMAGPNQIIVSEEAYEKIETLVQAVPANPIVMPDGKEPLKTYEINELL